MISNWLAFAVLVYGLGVGAHWWPGPVAAYRNWRARHLEDLDNEYADDGEYLDEDDVDHRPLGASGSARASRGEITEGDGRCRDMARDTGRDRDIEAGTSQDTGRDMRHPIPSRGLWTRVRQAADLVRGVERDTRERPSTVVPATPPQQQSPMVTEKQGPARDPELPSMPPRVVVHYVEPGSWTGQVAGTGEDGHPVVIRYITRTTIAAPTDLLTRPVPEPPQDEQAPGEAMAIDEITVRREWLRTMSASGRFTAEEIRDLYLVKWGKTPKTLGRDLAAIADGDDPERRGSG